MVLENVATQRRVLLWPWTRVIAKIVPSAACRSPTRLSNHPRGYGTSIPRECGLPCSTTHLSFPCRRLRRVPGSLPALRELRPEGPLMPLACRRLPCAPPRGGRSPVQPGHLPGRGCFSPLRTPRPTAAPHLLRPQPPRSDTPCPKAAPLPWERARELPEGWAASPCGFCRAPPGCPQWLPVQKAPHVRQPGGRPEKLPAWLHLRLRSPRTPTTSEPLGARSRHREGERTLSEPRQDQGAQPSPLPRWRLLSPPLRVAFPRVPPGQPRLSPLTLDNWMGESPPGPQGEPSLTPATAPSPLLKGGRGWETPPVPRGAPWRASPVPAPLLPTAQTPGGSRRGAPLRPLKGTATPGLAAGPAGTRPPLCSLQVTWSPSLSRAKPRTGTATVLPWETARG